MTPVMVMVAMLVVYRLSMLVTHDKLTEPIRDRLHKGRVERAHEAVAAIQPGTADYPMFPDGLIRCRCGVEYVGQPDGDWTDLRGWFNGHINAENVGGVQMTTPPLWLVLLDCHWCVSWWISVPVMWSAWCFGERGWWFIPAVGLAASGATGVIATYAKPD